MWALHNAERGVDGEGMVDAVRRYVLSRRFDGTGTSLIRVVRGSSRTSGVIGDGRRRYTVWVVTIMTVFDRV